MTGTKKQLSLYVHTHWDREWYWAFERYRTVLMSVLKRAVEAVESGELPSFHLDGQVCALEDFLELEPEFAERIRKLNAQNKLAIGPWYVLADQMLVNGESLIRNLEVGIKLSRRFGQPMMVGYNPDTFGHSQDLPRILQGFGIENAIVWRGVPELDQGPEFFWQSPDGSEVVAIALNKGYYQTMFHEVEGSESEGKIDALVEALLPWLSLRFDKQSGAIVASDEPSVVYSRYTNGCLVPVGGDHLKAPTNFARISELVGNRFVQLLSESGTSAATGVSAIELATVQLSEYLEMVLQAVQKPATPVRRIDGELRDNSCAKQHAAGYMLPGVLSTRLYLKRQNRILEHRLARLCEPIYALMSAANVVKYPAVELDNAWKYLLKNHPHDSMCGCSVDEVHREMMTRFSSIHQILDILDQRVKQELLIPGGHEWSAEDGRKRRAEKPPSIENAGFGRGDGELADPDVSLTNLAVLNVSTSSVSAPVRVALAIPDKFFAGPDGSATQDQQSASAPSPEAAPTEATSLASAKVKKTDKEMWAAANAYLLDLCGDATRFQLEGVRFETELFGELGGVPLYKDVHYLTGWVWVEKAAPLSVTRLPLSSCSAAATDGVSEAVVKASRSEISNDFFDLKVSNDGQITVDVRDVAGKQSFKLRHRFQDVADAGDSYNFDPILKDAAVQGRFASCETILTGPLVASLKLIYKIHLPEALVEDADESVWKGVEDKTNLVHFKRAKKTVEHKIETIVTLRRGVPLVFFDSTWNNLVGDHRLEVLFDTGAKVGTTWSENHFSLVERNVSSHEVALPVEKWTETPLDRFPCQRFFIANGQAFYNLGLPEYGVDGEEVSFTILRAISMLSRKRLLTRGGGAGPYMPTPEGNCLGLNTASYAWAPIMVLSNSTGFLPQGAAGGAVKSAGASTVIGGIKSAGTAKSKSVGDKRMSAGSGQLTDAERAKAYALAEQFEGVLWSTPLTSESEDCLADGSFIQVNNESLRIVTLYSTDGGNSLRLRLLNVSLSPQKSSIVLGTGWKPGAAKIEVVNLDGKVLRELKQADGAFVLECGPNELVTLQISAN